MAAFVLQRCEIVSDVSLGVIDAPGGRLFSSAYLIKIVSVGEELVALSALIVYLYPVVFQIFFVMAVVLLALDTPKVNVHFVLVQFLLGLEVNIAFVTVIVLRRVEEMRLKGRWRHEEPLAIFTPLIPVNLCVTAMRPHAGPVVETEVALAA